MRAALSVIVTTRNAEADLPELAPLLFEAVQEGLLRELLFADQGSTDGTARLAEALGAEMVDATGASDPRAAGAAAAKGEWLLLLDQRDRPETGWPGPAAAHLSRGGPGVFREGALADLAARVGRPGAGRALLVRAAEYRAGRAGRPRLLPVRNRRA